MAKITTKQKYADLERIIKSMTPDGPQSICRKLRVYRDGKIEVMKDGVFESVESKIYYINRNEDGTLTYVNHKDEATDPTPYLVRHPVKDYVFKAFNPKWAGMDRHQGNVININGDHNDNSIDNLRLEREGPLRPIMNRSGYMFVNTRNRTRDGTWCWCVDIYDHRWIKPKRISKQFLGGYGEVPNTLPPVPKHVIEYRNGMMVDIRGDFDKYSRCTDRVEEHSDDESSEPRVHMDSECPFCGNSSCHCGYTYG